MPYEGRQPGLMEQYAHLTGKRRDSNIGRNSTSRQKPLGGAAKKGLQGTIRRLMPDRGFGFIQAEGQKEDLFFHRSAVQKVTFEELKEGDFVEFEVQHDERKGRQSAINIRPATGPKRRTSPRAEPTKGRIFAGWQDLSTPTRQTRTNGPRSTSTSGTRKKPQGNDGSR